MLFQTLGCEDVEGRRDELDLDLCIGGVFGLGGAQGVFDGINTFVTKAGDLDVCADFGRLRCEAFANVGEELVFDDFSWKGDICPYVGIPAGEWD